MCHGSPSRPIDLRQLARVDGGIGGDIHGRLVRLAVGRVSRQAEVRLHLAPFFGEHQRQHERRARTCFATHASSARAPRGRVRGQRPAALAEQLLPARDVAILDDGELLEQLPPFGVRLDGRQRAIEVGGVPFVAIVLVPRRVGAAGGSAASSRLRRRARSIRSA